MVLVPKDERPAVHDKHLISVEKTTKHANISSEVNCLKLIKKTFILMCTIRRCLYRFAALLPQFLHHLLAVICPVYRHHVV